MTAYYNEFDPKAAAWLRELIKEKLIAPGEVDERSMKDVKPADLKGFTQCHFFAGIGGWSYALRLAGWPDAKPAWTGSCPCQPFSVAGKGKGTNDERHLWPAFRWLIVQRKPSVIFGEQVASKDGRNWLSGVRSDLEAMGYEPGGADLCAAGVGAPNLRQRLFWVAESRSVRRCEGIDDSEAGRQSQSSPGNSSVSGMGDSERCEIGTQHGQPKASNGSQEQIRGSGVSRGVGNPMREGRQGKSLRQLGPCDQGFWQNSDTIKCLDGKTRRIEPGTFPLAHGIPERVGLLRGYGNAINPWVAKIFIESANIGF